MKYTKTIEINVGDSIECLTEDGWEFGKVTKTTEITVTVFMEYIQKEKEFKIDLIRI